MTARHVAGEVVLRPGGKPYRARRGPVAEVLGGAWDDSQVIVWRTHDVDVATAIAGRAWMREGNGCEPLPGHVEVGWFRSVPWDAGSGYDWSVVSAVPSERGAVPAVVFR